VEAVAAGDEVARQFMRRAVVPVPDARLCGIDVVQRQVFHPVQQRTPRGAPRRVEILLDFVLAIDRDRASAGKLMHVDAMALAAEADMDAVVDESLALHALAQSDGVQQIHGALFQNARAHAIDHILFAACFEDHGVDAVQM